MRRENLIEQRARSPRAQTADDVGAGKAEAIEDAAGDEGGAVEAHAAMRQHAMAVRDEMRSEYGDRLQLLQVGQLLVEDGEVDVQTSARRGRDAFVETAFEIDHRVDAVGRDDRPILDDRRDEEVSEVVYLVERREVEGHDGFSHAVSSTRCAKNL